MERSFHVENDSMLINGISTFYGQAVTANEESEPISVSLPHDRWISTCGLNMLMVFVLAARAERPELRILVRLLPDEAVRSLLDGALVDDPVGLGRIANKLVFYQAVRIVPALRSANVIVTPSATVLERLQSMLGAHKKESLFSHSSNMLALSPLIESEAAQKDLTHRIRTLTSILYHKLYMRIDLPPVIVPRPSLGYSP